MSIQKPVLVQPNVFALFALFLSHNIPHKDKNTPVHIALPVTDLH